MKIAVVGGGPSGLYFALLAKKRMPDSEISVYEQNPSDATYGFGIALAERGLDRFRRADAASHDAIIEASFMAQNRLMLVRGERIFVEGGGYSGAIARLRLLDILRQHCELAGVEMRHMTRITDPESLDADLIVGADGVNSMVRQRHNAAFGTTSWQLGAKLAWYGTTKHFHFPILSFRSQERGHFWCVGYPYSDRMGTFVAECDAATWDRSGMAGMNDDDRKTLTEEIFAEELGGTALISNKSNWHSLPVTRTKQWHVGRCVLIGDALHSAHPSIGSGTRIAMEDAVALADALVERPGPLAGALALFRERREPGKLKLVRAAEKSFMWYEEVGPKIDALRPIELVFDYLTRTGRIDETRLAAEYPGFMQRYGDEWRAFSSQQTRLSDLAVR
jgi:2-polyprenyl-6-methoxyphenol hydroxylase-like FAD-dependent oxidoreductase